MILHDLLCDLERQKQPTSSRFCLPPRPRSNRLTRKRIPRMTMGGQTGRRGVRKLQRKLRMVQRGSRSVFRGDIEGRCAEHFPLVLSVLYRSVANPRGFGEERCHASDKDGKIKTSASNGLLHCSVSHAPILHPSLISSSSPAQRFQPPSTPSLAIRTTISLPM